MVSTVATQEEDSKSVSKSGLRSGTSSKTAFPSGSIGCILGVPGVKVKGRSCLLGCECWSNRCDFTSWDLCEGQTCHDTLPVNAMCNENSDCLTDKCSSIFSGTCLSKEIDEPCELSNECGTGRCEFASITDVTGLCAERLVDGESCLKTEDCVSESCPFFQCTTPAEEPPLQEIGELCLTDSNCESDNCEFSWGVLRCAEAPDLLRKINTLSVV